MHFHGEVAVEVVDQRSPRQSFPRRVRWKNKRSGRPGYRCNFGDGDIDRAASPTLVLVESPPGLLKAHFLDELVGTLNERLDILPCVHGTGNDGFVGARQRFGATLRTENRCRGHRQGQRNQETWQSIFHCHDDAPESAVSGVGS